MDSASITAIARAIELRVDSITERHTLPASVEHDLRAVRGFARAIGAAAADPEEGEHAAA